MDPSHLRLLRELRDRGSVTAVAAALGISASAVSQQLSTLQSSVAVPLTARRGRVLTLTAAGEALASASTRVDEALTAARDAVGALLDAGDRPVRVSSFHSAALALFAPLVRELGGTPAVHLADEDVAHRDFAGLTAGYDLVIAHRLSHDAPWPVDRVVVSPLIDEPLDIALHAEHPLAARAQLDLDDLTDQEWVSVHEGFPLAGVLDHLAARAGRPFRIAHRINEFSVTAEVVRTGAAIAIMPRTTASSLAVDGLVLRPLAGIELVRHVDVLARPDALAYTSVRSVLRALQVVAARVQRDSLGYD